MSAKFLTRSRELIHNNLSGLIKSESLIDQAMRYSVLTDSKVIRPALVLASGKLNSNLSEASLINLASAVELIHTYSLIHDDLPSMDNDDFRRGKESSHIKFGEAYAILAGDALHDLAFELITLDKDMSDSAKVKAVNILSRASGSSGMVLGQYLDIESENNNKAIGENEIEKIHSLKTGKLIQASINLGQLESSLSIEKRSILSEFGSAIGLAFQIHDDILDQVGESSVLGKSTQSDIKNFKQTYISVLGIEKSKVIANNLATKSIKLLENLNLDKDIETLKELADYMVNRNR